MLFGQNVKSDEDFLFEIIVYEKISFNLLGYIQFTFLHKVC